jgi:type I restriction enzyme S subunit
MASDSKRLPKHWVIKRLGDVCKTGAGGTPLKSNCKYYEGGTIPWLLSGEVAQGEISESKNFITQAGLDNSSAKIFPVNTVLVAMYGATAGQVGILRFEAATNQAICGIHPNEKLVPEFIYYAMLSKQAELIAKASGNAQPNISQIKVKNTEIPIPPIAEQKRIVAILDEAFEGIDGAIANTERNLVNARELFESYLNQKLLSVASSEPTQTLSCITELIVDCEHKTAPTQETGFPSIRTPNIGKGFLNFDNVNRVSEETYELWTRRAKPKPGDLILAREAPAGNVGVIPEGQTVCLGQRTVLIRPKSEITDSQYLAFLLLHPIMQKRLLAHSTGATVQHVNMKDIRELAISDLPPFSDQTSCVQELGEAKIQVNRLEAIYQQKLTALNELKQSILQKAFSGELTAEVSNAAELGAKEAIAA